MRRLKFKTAQSAWEGLNEFLAANEEELLAHDGGISGSQMMTYNNYVIIKRVVVDPKFDFGRMFGYTNRKWTSLINNYVNLQELDSLRNKIISYETKGATHYTAHMSFVNSHKSGKECLISLALCKELGKKKPTVYFHVRAGELTKRVLLDFLLVQRIVEYIYATNDVELHYIAPMLYITAENFVMYHTHKDLKKLLKGNTGKGAKKILQVLEHFSNVDETTVKYKVNLRSIRQVQKDEHGNPTSGRASLLAKDLHLW